MLGSKWLCLSRMSWSGSCARWVVCADSCVACCLSPMVAQLRRHMFNACLCGCGSTTKIDLRHGCSDRLLWLRVAYVAHVASACLHTPSNRSSLLPSLRQDLCLQSEADACCQPALPGGHPEPRQLHRQPLCRRRAVPGEGQCSKRWRVKRGKGFSCGAKGSLKALSYADDGTDYGQR